MFGVQASQWDVWVAGLGLGLAFLAGCAGVQQPAEPGRDGGPKTHRVVLAVDPPTAESNETRLLGQTTAPIGREGPC